MYLSRFFIDFNLYGLQFRGFSEPWGVISLVWIVSQNEENYKNQISWKPNNSIPYSTRFSLPVVLAWPPPMNGHNNHQVDHNF